MIREIERVVNKLADLKIGGVIISEGTITSSQTVVPFKEKAISLAASELIRTLGI